MHRFKEVKATWKIDSLPNRNKVFKAVGRGPVSVDLDPGKYTLVVYHFSPDKVTNFKYRETFLHGITEDQWAKLSNMRPKIARVVHTTLGIVYRCGFVGCKDEHTSRASAVIHECEHQGVDLFQEPEKYASAVAGLEKYAEAKSGKVTPSSRKPGRPRNSQ